MNTFSKEELKGAREILLELSTFLYYFYNDRNKLINMKKFVKSIQELFEISENLSFLKEIEQSNNK